MYRSILLPLDGSPFSESALPAAWSLARHTGAELRLLSVLETFSTTIQYDWGNGALEGLHQYLEGVASRMEGDWEGPVTTKVMEGHVTKAIQDQANHADLVVMATHGRGGLSRLWLGSVADAYVRHASGPVLLIRPSEEEEAPRAGDWSIRKMLLPLDGTPVSEAILGHAMEFGSLFNAVFHLTRVVQPSMRFSSYPPHMMQENRDHIEEAVEEASAYLKAQGDALREAGTTVEESVLSGVQPAHGILSEVEQAGCDVIAISAHSRGVVSRAVLGSTSDKVVRGTHHPVLLYRSGE